MQKNSKKGAYLGSFLLALLALFLLGPRADVDLEIEKVELPADLDTYLSKAEDSVGDVFPFATKTIRWRDSERRQRTAISVVYLHGFSATRQESDPLAARIAEELGANLFYTRLAGHGRASQDALASVTVNDWLNDAVEALAIGRALGDQVVVIGMSTGATLATWLAASEYGGHIDSLVLLSPNFSVRDSRARFLTWPWGKQIAERVLGPRRTWEARNELQARYWTTSYPTSSLVTMMALVDLANQVELAEIAMPTLMVIDPLDEVISPEAASQRFAELGASSKQLIRTSATEDPSHHVLAGNVLSKTTTEPLMEEILAFLQAFLF